MYGGLEEFMGWWEGIPGAGEDNGELGGDMGLLERF